MLAKFLIQALIRLVEERLGGLSLVDAADRRYLRELKNCHDELRGLLPEDQAVAEARTTGARLGRAPPFDNCQ